MALFVGKRRKISVSGVFFVAKFFTGDMVLLKFPLLRVVNFYV
jgi:hypothetical protein